MVAVDSKSTEKTEERRNEMTNTAMLENAIRASGLKKKHIYETLGISRQGLDLKIKGVNEFRASEIEKLCDLLKLTNRDRLAIFFAK